MPKIKIDPVTRLEGHMKIEVEVSGNRVVAAKSTGNAFRGFESLLVGRDPRDAVHITQRICGLCPVSHALAAVKAIEVAEEKGDVGRQGKLLRNLIQGANYLSSHILHFYHLSLPDYVVFPTNKALWQSNSSSDNRFNQQDSELFFENYKKALDIRRKAHEMAAIFAGKIPHVMSIMPGGVTKTPTAKDISQFRGLLQQVKAFVDKEYYQDVQKLASIYKDYFQIGSGYKNLISLGVFDEDDNKQLFINGSYTPTESITPYRNVDPKNIMEDTKYSWYANVSSTGALGQSFTQPITPLPGKSGAYSWIKAPRYSHSPAQLGKAYEAGPLARMWINGDYRQQDSISVMGRHLARMLESRKIAHAMQNWINSIAPDVQSYNSAMYNLSRQGIGIGVTEAPRGALVHYISYKNDKIDSYQIVTPTCWNASPMDSSNQSGPIEQALTGVEIADISKPVELMRIIHSFDPCTACAVHVITPEREIKAQFVVSP